MPRNKVAVHFTNGAVIKGHTDDFFPNRDSFRVTDWQTDQQSEVRISDLKAVFFVKNYEGDPAHNPPIVDLTPAQTGMGKKIQVKFKDGEIIKGYTSGYSPNRAAFFIFPADPRCNNERIYVVNAFTEAVDFV